MRRPFMAYENETDSFDIDELHIANRIDKIRIEGSVELTKDRQGLEYALKLKRVIDAAVEALKRNRNVC